MTVYLLKIPPPPNSQVTNSDYNQLLDEDRIIEGEYIVIFKEHWNRQINEQVGRQADLMREQVLASHNIPEKAVLNEYRYAIKGFAAKLTDAQVKALKKNPNIDRVTPNVMFTLEYTSVSDSIIESPDVKRGTYPAATTATGNWGVTRVGGPLDGTGKTAWVLDTGIDLFHPDLDVDVDNSVSFIPTESAYDIDGHGTHVAGIIASTGQTTGIKGVASGAKVVAIKVCGLYGCPGSSILNGIDYISIRAQPADIVNMSFGAKDKKEELIYIDYAVVNAADNGVRFTIAAGNDKQPVGNYSPARVVHPNTWTISAIDNMDKIASFSNYENPPIRYASPGVNILSLWKNGGTKTLDGTSMSAPHVAGLLLVYPNNIKIDGYAKNDPDGNPDPIASAATHLAAPFILGSVTNNHPQLSWSSVPHADSYKVYRRVEQGGWQWIGTMSTTSFTDWTITSSNLSMIFSPPPYWNNTIGYKITSTSSEEGYLESSYSNKVYYSTDGSCSPCQ